MKDIITIIYAYYLMMFFMHALTSSLPPDNLIRVQNIVIAKQ
jgi:hypothetical protein